MDRSSVVLPSIIDAIGDTPIVDLARLVPRQRGRILLKLDYLNPGFSKKDRIARRIVLDARAQGSLLEGQPVVELTSGNTGTGLAIVCAVLGHPFVAVMSAGNSSERARMMTALGAQVVLVPQAASSRPGQVSGADLDLVEREAARITEVRGAFRADQFGNASNTAAHADGTAEELWRQSGGGIDAFCDFVGSGGTLAGCAATLKRYAPDLRCYAVEPAQAAALAGQPVVDANHRVQGGGYAKAALPLLDTSVIDGFLRVTDDEAMRWARLLARTEGVFGGFSTGANVAAAMQLLDGPHAGSTVATLACDSGLKYLSTDLWP